LFWNIITVQVKFFTKPNVIPHDPPFFSLFSPLNPLPKGTREKEKGFSPKERGNRGSFFSSSGRRE